MAARWAHRHSIDVDLFVEPDRYRHFRWTTGGRFTLDLTASASVSRLAIRQLIHDHLRDREAGPGRLSDPIPGR